MRLWVTGAPYLFGSADRPRPVLRFQLVVARGSTDQKGFIVLREGLKSTVSCLLKTHASTICLGKCPKHIVDAPPISQAFGHVESSQWVPR